MIPAPPELVEQMRRFSTPRDVPVERAKAQTEAALRQRQEEIVEKMRQARLNSPRMTLREARQQFAEFERTPAITPRSSKALLISLNGGGSAKTKD